MKCKPVRSLNKVYIDKKNNACAGFNDLVYFCATGNFGGSRRGRINGWGFSPEVDTEEIPTYI